MVCSCFVTGKCATVENPDESSLNQFQPDLNQLSQLMQMPMFWPGLMPTLPGLGMGLNPLLPMMMPQLPPDVLATDPAGPSNAAAAAVAAQQKRARTRISDEQLKVLRAHFDINNSPSEEQVCKTLKMLYFKMF